jgi:Cu/Zn superoxide dismutase
MSHRDTSRHHQSLPAARTRSAQALAITALMTAIAVPVAWGAAALVTDAPLSDLQPTTASAFDGASAKVTLVTRPKATTTVLRVHGVDPVVAGRTFGAHLHEGSCLAGNGGLAGGHYNHTKVLGQPVVVSAATEIWLDVTVDADGDATSVSHVPFTVVPGQRSVVIHALPTDPGTGLAGERLACLPVVWTS